jgi:hypothetical protein
MITVKNARNDIAHPVRIWKRDVPAIERRTIRLAGHVNADLAEWLRVSSWVAGVLAERPSRG